MSTGPPNAESATHTSVFVSSGRSKRIPGSFCGGSSRQSSSSASLIELLPLRSAQLNDWTGPHHLEIAFHTDSNSWRG